MLLLQNISYIHPNKELLFDNIHLAVNHCDKVALIGNNGSGKSTLLRIIAGQLQAAAGQLERAGFVPDYVAIRRADDLTEPTAGERTGLVGLVAARLGSTRLIDNLLFDGAVPT